MKNLSTKIIIFLLLIGAILSGYNYFKRPFLQRLAQNEQPAEQDQQLDPRQQALAELSNKEKIMQLIALPVVLDEATPSASAQLAWIEANDPGFVTLFGSNLSAETVTDFTSNLAKLSTAQKPLVAVDHEGGTVQRLRGKGFTALASWWQNCQTTSAARVEAFSQSASELNRAGVQIVFAPVVDVAHTGSFLGSRACSDPEEVVATAKDYITSFAQYGILPVIKHFPGIGSLTTDPHRELDSVSLTASDTAVFNQLLNNFPNLGVMTTYVAVEGKTDGKPCGLSALCLQSFPTNFPQALIFSDALEMKAAGSELTAASATQSAKIADDETTKSLSQRAQEALLAGNDVLVFGETTDPEQITNLVNDLTSRYESEKIFRNRIDQAVLKILTLKLPEEQS